ncbi:MAG: His/Gly/Thr/Pro-type tRNA ligase C-terminal domain-containing protein [Candidatus Pacebacteria bacterium]|nr:His/Gly/Thr/Pro-type tRNA ligase C-terminal domain-containing protein [Candidatus Paceibacterota bacterium]
MKQSQLLYKSLKDAPKEADIVSHKLLLRGDFVSQLASGIYSFLPLGFMVLKKIEGIIRYEMTKIGAQEVFLPALQPKSIWEKTNRWDKMDPPLFKLKDRHQKEFALGSTHEEVVTSLVLSRIQSYKDLPLALFQIQDKFRNEMRFTGGLLRTREFLMKDLYSFHKDKDEFDSFFDRVIKSYENIFKRCGINALKSEASGGVFTSETTYEFQAVSEVGEDRIIYCPKCNWAANLEVVKVKTDNKCQKCGSRLVPANSIELGHTFRLGTKYSKFFDLTFIDKDGTKKNPIMGCYGIGLGRLMAAIVEFNNDKKGIIWPKETAPFMIHFIQLENDRKVKAYAEKIYNGLIKGKIEVLYDDRDDKTIGEKFAEADLIGIPYRVLISKKTLAKDSVEVKKRDKDNVKLIKIKDIYKEFEKSL